MLSAVQENFGGFFVILLLGEADGNNLKSCPYLNFTPMNPTSLVEDSLQFYSRVEWMYFGAALFGCWSSILSSVLPL